MDWVSLKEWGRIHGIAARTVRKLIDEGLISKTDYLHSGKLWRVKADAEVHSRTKLRLPPCKDYLKVLEAI